MVAATFDVAELLQWRIEHSGPAGQVRIGFLDGGRPDVERVGVDQVDEARLHARHHAKGPVLG